MSRIGLKYITSVGIGFPAVNGGRWNIASNFYNNYRKLLLDAAIDEEDDESVAIFMKFITEGMLICAAHRSFSPGDGKREYEALWMYIPRNTIITSSELAEATEELTKIFSRPEAFTSAAAFEDILPEIFRKVFPDPNINDKSLLIEKSISELVKDKDRMSGNRIGFIEYTNNEELGVILSTGFSNLYKNFGLILLTDNAIPVEASLPRIYLPELSLFRQQKREAEEDKLRKLEEEKIDEKTDENIGEKIEDNTEEKEKTTEENKEYSNEEIEGTTEESKEEEIDEDKVEEIEKETEGEEEEKVNQEESEKIEEPEPMEITREFTDIVPVESVERKSVFIESWKSFWLGFIISAVLFVIALLLIK